MTYSGSWKKSLPSMRIEPLAGRVWRASTWASTSPVRARAADHGHTTVGRQGEREAVELLHPAVLGHDDAGQGQLLAERRRRPVGDRLSSGGIMPSGWNWSITCSYLICTSWRCWSQSISSLIGDGRSL